MLTEEDVDSILEAAEKENKAEALEALGPFQEKINHRDEDEMTPLIHAIREKKNNVVRTLLVAKADVMAKAKLGNSPLHMAAEQGSVLIIELLLKAGAKMEDKNENFDTPLHIALSYSRLNAVKILLERKADIMAKGYRDGTPLHAAADAGFLPGIRLLIKAGAKIEDKSCLVGDMHVHGHAPPLHMPLYSHSISGTPYQLATIKTLLELNADVMAKGVNDKTLLQLSVQGSDSSTVLFLLERGVLQDFNESYDTDPYRLLIIYQVVKPCFIPQNLHFLANAFELLFLRGSKINRPFLRDRTALFELVAENFEKIKLIFFAHHKTELKAADEILKGPPEQAQMLVLNVLPSYLFATHLAERSPKAFSKACLTVLENIAERVPLDNPSLRELCAAYVGLPPSTNVPPVFSEVTQNKMLEELLGNTWDKKTSLEALLADKHQELLQMYLDSTLAKRASELDLDRDQSPVESEPRNAPHMLNALRLALKPRPVLRKKVENVTTQRKNLSYSS